VQFERQIFILKYKFVFQIAYFGIQFCVPNCTFRKYTMSHFYILDSLIQKVFRFNNLELKKLVNGKLTSN